MYVCVNVLHLIAQATATTSPHPAAWVVLGVAAISAVTSVVLAVIRKTASSRIVAAERTAKEALALAQALAAKVTEQGELLGEQGERIDDMDERVSSTDPGLRLRDERIAKLEHQLAQEHADREVRRREQSLQDLKLADAFARIDENVKNLKERVGEANNGRRRA